MNAPRLHPVTKEPASALARAAFSLCVALILTLAAASPALSLSDPPGPTHGSHGKLACDKCHAGGETADCDKCHEPGYNPHPINIPPTTPVPADLPLDKAGTIRCFTCHRIHGGATADSYIRNGGEYHSRRVFCFKCHTEGMAGTNPHDARQGPSRCLFCHLPDKAGSVWPSTKIREPVAVTCRFCHGISDAGHARLMGLTAPEPVGGRANCPSCHDPHGTAATIYDLRPEMTGLLGRTQETNPHVESWDKCRMCHTKAFADEIRASEQKLLYGGNVTMLCLSCHVTMRSHHPTSVTLDAKMAETLGKSGLKLPLDRRGMITCHTCHDNGCQSGAHKMSMRYYERKKLSDALCWGCHEKAEFANVDPHTDDPVACKWCHESRPAPGVSAERGIITSPTMLCLRCHDVKPHPAGVNHVGINHRKPIVEKTLPLGPDGEINCTSCHDPHYRSAIPSARLRAKSVCRFCHENKM